MTSVWAAFSAWRDFAWTMIELIEPYPVSVSWTAVSGAIATSSWSVVPLEPLEVGDADHREVGAVDLDGVADRVGAVEQLGDDRRADHQHAAVRLLLGLVNHAPLAIE